MLHLRPYQKEALKSVQKSFKNKIHKQLIVLPTGAGKTILFIAITKHFQRKTLILAHRNELITQAYNKFKSFYPDADVAIYQGKQNNLDHQVIISSVQTCNARIEQLKKKGFKLLIIDECHHSKSSSYENIITQLGFFDNPKKLLIGVTATPMRSDKKSLGDIFQEITYAISIQALIKEKYLSSVFGRKILTHFKLTGIQTYMGDFAVRQLSQAVNIPERNTFIVSKYKEHALDRKTIVFCVDVQHCKDIAEEFSKHDIIAAAVWGDMNSTERKNVLKSFCLGDISIVTSCGILTEGFDEPSVACIVMARPTKSTGLYTQMVGRGLRIDTQESSNKKDCLVLDFTDQYHNLNGLISLTTVLPEAAVIIDQNEIIKNNQISTTMNNSVNSVASVDKELNLFASNEFNTCRLEWIFSGIMHSEWSLSDDHFNEVVIVKNRDLFSAYVYFENGITKQLFENKPDFKTCKKICEEWGMQNLIITYADANSSWHLHNSNVKASSNQMNLLQKNNVYHRNISKAAACYEIRKIIATSKLKQRKTSNHNNHVEISNISNHHTESLQPTSY